nr:serine/arginine repetitive matrix protein 2-like [Ipomoea batatas]
MTKKLPIAPFPRTPPKIYKVEAEKFKETVQMLTTAPGFQSNNPSRRLQEVAPPPLNLKPRKCSHNNALSEQQIRSETTLNEGDIPPIISPDFLGDGFSQLWAFSPIGFGSLSPSSLAQWASILPSPGTLSSL